jgi:hypothetical protein
MREMENPAMARGVSEDFQASGSNVSEHSATGTAKQGHGGERASYVACSIRERRTRAEVQAIREAITSVLTADHPQTVRQVFYQLVARAVIEKTEKEYQGTVARLLSEMRLEDKIRWDWIVDESRRTRGTQTFDNITDALAATAKFYRRSALKECGD